MQRELRAGRLEVRAPHPVLRCALGAVALLAMMGGAPSGWTAEDAAPDPEHQPFQYDANGRRDPFVPLVRNGRPVAQKNAPTRLSASPLVLYGILWDPGGRSIAMINDSEASVGDLIEGYRVLEIQEDAVVLDGGGQKVRLTISFEKLIPDPSQGATTGGEGP